MVEILSTEHVMDLVIGRDMDLDAEEDAKDYNVYQDLDSSRGIFA